MEIKRDIYLNKLIRKRKNGLIKVVTGIRRCGKSYLLFSSFSQLSAARKYYLTILSKSATKHLQHQNIPSEASAQR